MIYLWPFRRKCQISAWDKVEASFHTEEKNKNKCNCQFSEQHRHVHCQSFSLILKLSGDDDYVINHPSGIKKMSPSNFLNQPSKNRNEVMHLCLLQRKIRLMNTQQWKWLGDKTSQTKKRGEKPQSLAFITSTDNINSILVVSKNNHSSSFVVIHLKAERTSRGTEVKKNLSLKVKLKCWTTMTRRLLCKSSHFSKDQWVWLRSPGAMMHVTKAKPIWTFSKRSSSGAGGQRILMRRGLRLYWRNQLRRVFTCEEDPFISPPSPMSVFIFEDGFAPPGRGRWPVCGEIVIPSSCSLLFFFLLYLQFQRVFSPR